MKFSTKAIHIGQNPEPNSGAVIPPIYMTSTFIQDAPNKHKGYDYTRAGNPNFTNLEKTLAALEKAKYATVFSSGIGATTALISTLKQGDTVIGGNDLYGGTFRLFKKIFKKFGIKLIVVDTQNLQAVEKALQKKPKMIFLESPSNPLLKISNIRVISKLAKKYKTISVVDNTFATPYFQQPIQLGADIALHSTTKYISGHSDVVGGAIITNNKQLKQKMQFARMSMGLNPSPFDVWLTTRGLKTLAVRMEKHAQNAKQIAEFLDKHPLVKRVFYPGLETHPNYKVAQSQMKGYSGIVSVEFNLNLKDSIKLISSFKVFTLAESLGGIESLVNHPASMTHASISAKQRQKQGLNDGLIRLSIGIEDPKDLLDDLKTQLQLIHKKSSKQQTQN